VSDLTPAGLIRAEIKRRTDAHNVEYGYDEGSGEYEDLEREQECELRSDYDQDADGVAAWQYSRHYEVKAVAKQLGGRWVSWLYWYGGGKHGEPDSIDWIDDSIFLEEGEPVIVKTFRKATS
jgi:hypothetical protein